MTVIIPTWAICLLAGWTLSAVFIRHQLGLRGWALAATAAIFPPTTVLGLVVTFWRERQTNRV